MGNAKNSIMGLFMLWWGFLAFNSGSTFGVSGRQWMYSAKATVTTMNSSFGGGSVGLAVCYIFFGGKIKVPYICNCVFGSLVAITGCSYVVATWEAIIIGVISGMITFLAMMALERSSIDDPCASFAVHGLSGAWGLLAVGIFGHKEDGIMEYPALIRGGYYLFFVQLLAVAVIAIWASVTTYILLWVNP